MKALEVEAGEYSDCPVDNDANPKRQRVEIPTGI